jgi:hypothetical protein
MTGHWCRKATTCVPGLQAEEGQPGGQAQQEARRVEWAVVHLSLN